MRILKKCVYVNVRLRFLSSNSNMRKSNDLQWVCASDVHLVTVLTDLVNKWTV